MYDIESFVSRWFEDYRYCGNPATDISICCPFCVGRGNDVDTKYHLQVCIDSDKQVVHCFRCGYSANWVQFVIDVTNYPYFKALAELYVTPTLVKGVKSVAEAKLTRAQLQEHTIRQYSLLEDFQLLKETATERLAKVAWRYLTVTRGISVKTIRKYRLGISQSIGYRVIIPIERGYWQGRALYSWLTPKYLNPKEPADDILFNSQALQLYKEVVICEGAFSAMAIGNNAVALIGKEATADKVKRLIESDVDEFIIALESGAFLSMGKLADALIANGKKVVVWGYQGLDDPASSYEHSVIPYNLKSKLSLLLS